MRSPGLMEISPPVDSSSPESSFQKGRFARAVRADHAVAVAGRELQVDVLKQRLSAELQTEIETVIICHHLLQQFSI